MAANVASEVYRQTAQPMIEHVLSGRNATVFAYGPPGFAAAAVILRFQARVAGGRMSGSAEDFLAFVVWTLESSTSKERKDLRRCDRQR